jgi:serine protease
MRTTLPLLRRALCATLAVLSGAAAAVPVTPTDTYFATRQWWLHALPATGDAGLPDLSNAWSRSTGVPKSGAGPVIAVLDTGIVPHPELDARLVLPGYDFISNAAYANEGDTENADRVAGTERDANPYDRGDRLTRAEADANPALWEGCAVATSGRSSWHGTMIAGQIGAVSNDGQFAAGINWHARILPVRVAGRCGAAPADVVDGLRWAAGLPVAGVPLNANPARIVVIGFAGFKSCNVNDSDPTVAAAARDYVAAIQAVRAKGVLVVAAAGNGAEGVGRPANCPGVFAVTALNRQGFKANYANFGPEVALATVGGDMDRGATCDKQVADGGILSTSNKGDFGPGEYGWAEGGGTSYASPIVAGVASLMLAANPDLTVDQLEAGLRATARPHALVPLFGNCATGNNTRCTCTTATCGSGILDADQALAYAVNPAGYAAPARTAPTLRTTAIEQCAVAMGKPVPGDPPASAPTSTPVDAGGGGGGAAGLSELLALLGLLVLLCVKHLRRR